MTNIFRLSPTPAHATDAEISGLFRMLEPHSSSPPLTCPTCGSAHPSDRPCTIYRQRFECTCGFHGYRELAIVPSHIKCPRCAGVAIGRGRAELVS